MAQQPLQVCGYPGCNNLTAGGRCPHHRTVTRQRAPDTRMAPHQRGYDYVWKKTRRNYLNRHPVCEIQTKCRGAPANEVDHIQPISQGGDRLNWNNLQAACKPCHSHKTATQDMPRCRKAKPKATGWIP